MNDLISVRKQMELAIVLMAAAAVVLAAFGMVKGYPFWAIKQAFIVGPALVLGLSVLLYGLQAGAASGGGWWLLAALGGAIALIGGLGVWSYLRGDEIRLVAEMVRDSLEEKRRKGDPSS